jgi:hypothetical protein
MARYSIETSAVITQTVEINADSIETAQEWAMDLLKHQLEDYQKAAIFESNTHHNTFEIYEYETMQASEAG